MIKHIISILCCIILVSCHEKNNSENKPLIISVYPKSNSTHLYYSGTIKPIQEDLLISPAGGVISKINFHYGDFIKKGELLMKIHSPEMENEFRDAISNYLKVRLSYLNSKKSMIGLL